MDIIPQEDGEGGAAAAAPQVAQTRAAQAPQHAYGRGVPPQGQHAMGAPGSMQYGMAPHYPYGHPGMGPGDPMQAHTQQQMAAAQQQYMQRQMQRPGRPARAEEAHAAVITP